MVYYYPYVIWQYSPLQKHKKQPVFFIAQLGLADASMVTAFSAG